MKKTKTRLKFQNLQPDYYRLDTWFIYGLAEILVSTQLKDVLNVVALGWCITNFALMVLVEKL